MKIILNKKDRLFTLIHIGLLKVKPNGDYCFSLINPDLVTVFGSYNSILEILENPAYGIWKNMVSKKEIQFRPLTNEELRFYLDNNYNYIII